MKRYPPAAISRAAQRLLYEGNNPRVFTFEEFKGKVLANPELLVKLKDFAKVVFDPNMGAMDYRCYDGFPNVAAAEAFFKEAQELYGVAGIMVFTPDDPIMKQHKHGCDRYPFVLMQEGWQVGSSVDFIAELANLAEKHGGTYQYS